LAVISHHESSAPHPLIGNRSEESVVSRLKADRAFQQVMRKSMHPGVVMIVTDNPLYPNLRSGKDFVIMISA
jgi:hypothetical protein